ncbi:aspergillopepsin [Peniophora sp. CONT]|nr:aspergillopepsin [Peniophora sp. CONT]
MKFTASLLAQIVLATSVFAVPSSKERLASRVARREAGRLSSQPKIPGSGLVPTPETTNSTHPTEFSSNWSGAVLIAGSGTFKTVTGTFTVPTPREPSGSTSSHSSSAWVGIDGDTCGSAILQTGVDFTVSGTRTSFDAWFEWFPAAAVDFSGFPVSAGDSITATVTATSTTAGTATLLNHRTGTTVSHSFTRQPALCQENAEWIVEDFEEGGSLVPLSNFGTVTFTGASASGVSLSGATIINMEQNGRVLTSASASGTSVTVEYTGP